MKTNDHLLKTLFISIFASCIFFVQIACEQQAQRPERTQLSEGSRPLDDNEDEDDPFSGQQTGDGQATEEEKIERIDASKLAIYSLRITKQRERLSLTHNMSYEVDGRARWINYRICPLENVEKQCSEGYECAPGGNCVDEVTIHNRVKLPLLYAGKVLFKVRACTDAEYSTTDEICGGWEEKQFNSQVFDIRVATLMGRAMNLRKTLGELNKGYKKALDTYVDEAKACEGLNAEVQKVLDSKVKIIETIREYSEDVFAEAGEYVADVDFWGLSDRDVGTLVGDGLSGLGKEFEKQCAEVGEVFDDWVCGAARIGGFVGKTMLLSMSPVTALGTVSNSLHDIYYGTFLGQGDKLVPKACLAEQNLQRTSDAIKISMDYKLQELRLIKQQLEDAGESTVIPAEEDE